MFSCCKSLPQVFTLLYANPANRKWGLSREVKQLPLQSMLYYCYYKAAKATRAVSSKRFVLFTMLQVPKPISWVHKKKQETGPWSVIQFFCLNSEAAFTQLLDIVFFISAAELRGHAMLYYAMLHCFLPNSLSCKTPCHKFEDVAAAGLSGSSRAGSKDALVQFGEKIQRPLATVKATATEAAAASLPPLLASFFVAVVVYFSL